MLLVRADASPEIGTGHVMRCLALAHAWQKAGGSVTFAMSETLLPLVRHLRSQNIASAAIAAPPGSNEDADLTMRLATTLNAICTVVDGYRFAPEYYRALKAAGNRVMAVDDDGRHSEYCADILLNQNLCATDKLYPNRDPNTRLLLGTQFALLRPEFRRQPQAQKIRPVAHRLLVTMGGSDPDNVTSRVMQALEQIDQELEATIVIGPGNRHLNDLDANPKCPTIRLVRDPANMAALMADCDMAISAAGSTCWELAYLGIPMILVVLSPDQLGIARALHELGVSMSLGWHASLTPSQLISGVKWLGNDPVRRCAMSHAGQALVDGRGAERVVEFLLNSLCEYCR